MRSVTPKEAAEILGLEYTTVLHHLKRTGQLAGRHDEAGRWQVDPDSVAAFQERKRRKPGQGRRASPDTVRDSTRRTLFLGNKISPEDVARIRRLLPARLRAALLLRLAEMAEREPESFKRALRDLGVEWS